jgi:DMSO/TMAO reductase YedYZ heme-binding membrane subunit
MTEQFWWFLTRSSGLVAWALLMASMVWGVLLATRVLKPHDKPGWLLDLHRWLGALTVVFVGVHLLALVLDDYVTFGWSDLLIPFASGYARFAVGLGVIALYLLIAVQVSSLAMRRIPTRYWRWLHLTSYALVLMTSWHAVLVGTDVGRMPYSIVAVLLSCLPILALVVRLASPPSRGARGPRRSAVKTQATVRDPGPSSASVEAAARVEAGPSPGA